MKSWVGQALLCRFVLELIDFKLKNDAQESCMRVNFVLFKGFRLTEFEKVVQCVVEQFTLEDDPPVIVKDL